MDTSKQKPGTRAARRRKQQVDAPESSREPTQSELDAAEKELREDVDDLDYDVTVRWAALLDKWHGFEHQRESAEMDYKMRAELPGSAKDAIRVYATSKKALLAVEREMLDLLMESEETEREDFLQDRHMIPTPGGGLRIVKCSDMLRSRLTKGLEELEGAGGRTAQGDNHETPKESPEDPVKETAQVATG